MLPEMISKDDAAKETRRRWVSAFIVGAVVFGIGYVIVIANYERWGTALGWMPASAFAAAFGWIGYRFPWIGEVISFLLELLAFFVV